MAEAGAWSETMCRVPREETCPGETASGPRTEEAGEGSTLKKGFESFPAYVRVGWGLGLPCLPCWSQRPDLLLAVQNRITPLHWHSPK